MPFAQLIMQAASRGAKVDPRMRLVYGEFMRRGAHLTGALRVVPVSFIGGMEVARCGIRKTLESSTETNRHAAW